MRFLALVLVALFPFSCLRAQDDVRLAIKEHINKLSATSMEGRGYVNKGAEKAALYIQARFRDMALAPVNPDGTFVQFYNFRVNTFPGAMQLRIKDKMLIPGYDYLVDAMSSSSNMQEVKVTTINLDRVKDSTKWEEMKGSFSANKVYYLRNADSFCKRFSIPFRKLAQTLPEACFIIPVHGKMTWTVGTDTIAPTVFYVQDTVLPRKLKKVSVNVKSILQNEYRNANMLACVPGEIKDTFIVFSAHYDHLGRMGSAVFPGASDNASGTAMMLYLAKYFSKHPQRYSIAFIGFSGEEAGLKGSDYFVKNPLIPLSNIKFLTNLDIMGDAKDGITVVNGTEYPEQFRMLKDINEEKGYLPEIKSRGKAANSDHYHFSEAGVPAIFIYSNGGKGYYHDIFDKASEIGMTNIVNVSKLLIEFTDRLNQK